MIGPIAQHVTYSVEQSERRCFPFGGQYVEHELSHFERDYTADIAGMLGASIARSVRAVSADCCATARAVRL